MALRGVEQLALETGLLTHSVLPRKLWPKYTPRPKQAITEKEHRLLQSNSLKRSWRCFLEILWETGASQSDAASLRIEKLTGGEVTYRRCKTGVRAAQQISLQLAAMLASLAGERTKRLLHPASAEDADEGSEPPVQAAMHAAGHRGSHAAQLPLRLGRACFPAGTTRMVRAGPQQPSRPSGVLQKREGSLPIVSWIWWGWRW